MEQIIKCVQNVYTNDTDLLHIKNCIVGLKKRQIENEELIAQLEPNVTEKINLRTELTKNRTQLDTLVNIKSTIGPLKMAFMWLAAEYPDTANMTLMQILEFIDSSRGVLISKQNELRNNINTLEADEAKYHAYIKRRVSLNERLEIKESELEETITMNLATKQKLQGLVQDIDIYKL